MSFFGRIFGRGGGERVEPITNTDAASPPTILGGIDISSGTISSNIYSSQQLTLSSTNSLSNYTGNWSTSVGGGLYGQLGTSLSGVWAPQPAYTSPPPPPPPKVKYVGGDHPWHDWTDIDEYWGLITGVLYKDIFVPANRVNEIVLAVAATPTAREEWNGKSLEEKKEHIYLEARRMLIVDG